jgi:formylglycine-generating enzyme required for sulfatase activity
MNGKVLIVAACLLALSGMAFSAHSYASPRGIEVAGVKTDAGQKIDLYDNSYALVVGVAGYDKWPVLEQVPSEIDKVSQILRKHGFTVEEVVNPDDKELQDSFESFIDNYGYDKKNRLLFFYAGHGYTMDDGKNGYLVPKNAPDPRKDRIGFLRNALDMNQILAWCRKMRANHALFLFDSCFSGTIFKQRALPDTPPAISRLASKPVRQFITAGTAGEQVPASSTFTPAFVDALEYGLGDLNEDGYISGTELGLYLQDKVPRHVRQTPQYGKITDYGLSRGDYIFLAGGSAYYPESETSSSKSGDDDPSAGDTWTEPVTGMEFVRVPGGCYQMGCGSWDGNCYDSEKPVHEVCLDGFWMGRYEVTQGEWKKIMGNNPSRFDKGNNYPVEQVSWNDCRDFIEKLNKRSSRNFRLPTEAEWEYAARSGGKKEKYAGGNNVGRLAWYRGNSGGHTHEVGTKSPNGLGIYDMSGNVWEWVEDKYHDSYQGAPTDGSARVSGSGSGCVIRGGSWSCYPGRVRAAYRFGFDPGSAGNRLGFRLCLPQSGK